MSGGPIPTATISSVRLRLMSPSLTRLQSVQEITPANGVNSPSLGSTSPNRLCPTCGKTSPDCVNHFAAMSLAVPATNPEMLHHVVKLLRCVCFSCSRLLISPCLDKMPKQTLKLLAQRPGKITKQDFEALNRFLAMRSDDLVKEEPPPPPPHSNSDADDDPESDADSGPEPEPEAGNESDQSGSDEVSEFSDNEEPEPEPEPDLDLDPEPELGPELGPDDDIEPELEDADPDRDDDESDPEPGSRGSRSSRGSLASRACGKKRKRGKLGHKVEPRSKAVLRSSQTQLEQLLRILKLHTGLTRLKHLADICERIQVCGPGPGTCGAEQPCFAVDGQTILVFSRDLKKSFQRDFKAQAATLQPKKNSRYLAPEDKTPVSDHEIQTHSLWSFRTLALWSALNGIPDDDARLMGLQPEYSRPADLLFCVLPVCPPCIRPKLDYSDAQSLKGQSELTKVLDRVSKTAENLRKHASEFQEHFEFLVEHQYEFPGLELFLPLALYLTELDTYWLSRFGCHYYADFRPPADDFKSEAPTNLANLRAREQKMRIAARELEFVYKNIQGQISGMFAKPSKGSQPAGHRGGSSNATYRDLVSGKKGWIRNYMTAKRRVKSGRGVISPDHEAPIAWAGFPLQMAMTLTYTEPVTEFNIHRLTRTVMNGPNQHPGANFILRKTHDGDETTDLRFIDTTQIVLQTGMKVERHAMTGDMMIFNRQPSLHRMNMFVMWIWVSTKFKVIKIPLAVTTPTGADFDGDEMTVLAVNDPQARAESHMMFAGHHMMSPKNGTVIYVPVFDSVLGPALLTAANLKLDLGTVHGFFGKLNPNLFPRDRSLDTSLRWFRLNDPRRQKIAELFGCDPDQLSVAECDLPVDQLSAQLLDLRSDLDRHSLMALLEQCGELDAKRFSGADLFSCLLPPDFNLTVGAREHCVRIRHGRMTGQLTKTTLTAVLGVVNRVYGSREAENLLFNMQCFANEFLSFYGCSYGLDDMRLSDKTELAMRQVLARAIEYSDGRLNPPANAQEEKFLQDLLQETRERAGRYALHELRDRVRRGCRNGALETVESGVGGNLTTVLESCVMIGQLFNETDRLTTLLPIFHPKETKKQYVLKTGFVPSSHLRGLKPTELYSSGMMTRQGQTDTATKTSRTGYLARRLTKGMEGTAVDFDGYVRASNGDLISLAFGGDGFDGMFVINTPLNLLGLSEEEVWTEHQVPGDVELSQTVVAELLRLRAVFLRIYANENRCDELVEGLGQMSVIASLAHEPLPGLPGLPSRSTSLTAREIYELTRECLETDILSRHKVVPLAFLATVLEQFSPVKLLGTTRDQLLRSLETLARLHARALVQPRTQVGIIAAQSTGEPATQLTLKTTHNAGHKVNLGIARLNEIIGFQPTKKMETPVMEFYISNSSREDCDRFANRIRGTRLASFVRSQSGPDATSTTTATGTTVSRLRRLGRVSRTIRSLESKEYVEIQFELDATRLKEYGLSVAGIVDRCLDTVFGRNKSNATVVYDTHGSGHTDSTDSGHTETAVVLFEIAKDDSVLLNIAQKLRLVKRPKKMEHVMALGGWGPPAEQTPDTFDDDELEFPLQVLKRRLLHTVVVGSELVTEVDVVRQSRLSFEKVLVSGLRSPASKESVWKLQTTGSDFGNLLRLLWTSETATARHVFDWTSCITNSIEEVHRHLGIAAATRWIHKQLQQVLTSTGSHVHARYTWLVAQAMTQDGTVQAFGRYGVIKLQRSLLARAGFEVAIKVIMEAALTAELDPLNGITESVITGQRPRIGTAQVLVKPRAVTPYELWKLRPVFEENSRTLRKRAVTLGDDDVVLLPEDEALLSLVSRSKRVELRKTNSSAWCPRKPDWGRYSVHVLKFATCLADIERLHQAAFRLQQIV